MPSHWTVRSIQDDIIIEQRKGYCIAEYEPLELKCEGGTEREARDALMLDIWARVARMYEDEVTRWSGYFRPTIKEVMDEHIYNYWQTHTPKERVKEEKMGVVVIEYDGPDMRLQDDGWNYHVMRETPGQETHQDLEEE